MVFSIRFFIVHVYGNFPMNIMVFGYITTVSAYFVMVIMKLNNIMNELNWLMV